MIVLEVSYSELREVRRKDFLEREQKAMLAFSDGEGTGCLIEFNPACGYRVSSFEDYGFQHQSGAVEDLEDALDLATGIQRARALRASSHPSEEPWEQSLNSTARNFRMIVENARAMADEWPVPFLVVEH